MREYKAVLFDLDDTLLDRDQAVNNMFFVILEKCYKNVGNSLKSTMLEYFRTQDKRAYGKSDKTGVLEALFDEFPPEYRLPNDETQNFWNYQFPACFSINENTITFLNTIKNQVKVALITNGTTQRQKEKIRNTDLERYFDAILISEEAGFTKPDKQIFDLALTELNVQPEEAIFVGDDLEMDMAGCQNAGIKGIWFNP
ncbi:HAD family hydrolase [Alteribacter lacisalsi]|uniref:HAD family hydrolase n=1 Tax=Alteribacter lacisalsi TaxID=2045244 RepID=UPI00267C5292